MSQTLQTRPGGSFTGVLRVPGDKSISHRAIMFAALADGVSHVSGFLNGEDCLATLRAFRAMGVAVDEISNTELRVHGVGIDGLRAPSGPLDLGNSGTSMRLMSGLLAGQPFDTVLTGDASLSTRPMRRVTEPLARMGAAIDSTEAGTAPLHIHGRRSLRGIDFESPVASAQVKSAVLLAGLYAHGTTTVTEPGVSRDHTERMLSAFGVAVGGSGLHCSVAGGQRLTASDVQVPADLSSATFPMVAALLTPGAEITLEGVGINASRAGVLKILEMMGGDFAIENQRAAGAEPIADIRVRHSALQGVDIPPALVPLAIDEFPAVFAAAALANGTTRVSGAAELRVKESDRLAAMANGLRAVGVAVDEFEDGMAVQGGQVDSHGDHRIAMAFAAIGAAAQGQIEILNTDNVATSFPGFVPLFQSAGFNLEATA